jgi:hypothetical protein
MRASRSLGSGVGHRVVAARPGLENAQLAESGHVDGAGEVDGAGYAYAGRREEWCE